MGVRGRSKDRRWSTSFATSIHLVLSATDLAEAPLPLALPAAGSCCDSRIGDFALELVKILESSAVERAGFQCLADCAVRAPARDGNRGNGSGTPGRRRPRTCCPDRCRRPRAATRACPGCRSANRPAAAETSHGGSSCDARGRRPRGSLQWIAVAAQQSIHEGRFADTRRADQRHRSARREIAVEGRHSFTRLCTECDGSQGRETKCEAVRRTWSGRSHRSHLLRRMQTSICCADMAAR